MQIRKCKHDVRVLLRSISGFWLMITIKMCINIDKGTKCYKKTSTKKMLGHPSIHPYFLPYFPSALTSFPSCLISHLCTLPHSLTHSLPSFFLSWPPALTCCPFTPFRVHLSSFVSYFLFTPFLATFLPYFFSVFSFLFVPLFLSYLFLSFSLLPLL